MTYKARISFETLRSAVPGAIGAAYATIGTPTTMVGTIIHVSNQTNGDVFLTTDASRDTFPPFPANSYTILDVSTNALPESMPGLAKNTQFYVKDGATASTTGTFYVAVYGIEEV